jgi:hypothetical protein
MGFFSWKTQDTGRSIANCHSDMPTFGVWMLDDKGNKWFEPSYNGYGDFGGKDFYELLAEMNGLESDRSEGITLAFSGKKFKSPNLVENVNKWYYTQEGPKDCEFQGYFY